MVCRTPQRPFVDADIQLPAHDSSLTTVAVCWPEWAVGWRYLGRLPRIKHPGNYGDRSNFVRLGLLPGRTVGTGWIRFLRGLVREIAIPCHDW